MILVFIFLIGALAGKIILYLSSDVSKSLIAWKKDSSKHEFKGKSLKVNIEEIASVIKDALTKRVLTVVFVGIIYCLLFIKYKISIDFIRYASVISVIMVAAVIDSRTKYVYFKTVLAGILINSFFIVIELVYFNNLSVVKLDLLGGISALIGSAAIALLNGIGWGDVEILFICGLLIGIHKMLLFTILAVLFMVVRGMYIMIKERKIRGIRLAFVPYIFAALLIVTLI